MEFKERVQSWKNNKEAIMVGGICGAIVVGIAVGGALGANKSISQEGKTALYREEIPRKASSSSGETGINLRHFPGDNEAYKRFIDRLTELGLMSIEHPTPIQIVSTFGKMNTANHAQQTSQVES